MLKIGATVSFLIISTCAFGESLRILDEGKSDYVIATPANPTAVESFAAQELNKYLTQVAGAKLRVVETRQTGGVRAILVREYLHRTLGRVEHRPGEWSITVDGPFVRVEGAGDFALLQATYGLLDSMGWRFLAPQFDYYHGTAEVVPQQKTLTLSDDLPKVWISLRS